MAHSTVQTHIHVNKTFKSIPAVKEQIFAVLRIPVGRPPRRVRVPCVFLYSMYRQSRLSCRLLLRCFSLSPSPSFLPLSLLSTAPPPLFRRGVTAKNPSPPKNAVLPSSLKTTTEWVPLCTANGVGALLCFCEATGCIAYHLSGTFCSYVYLCSNSYQDP